MSRLLQILLLAVFLVAIPARAATGLDSARQSAQSARARVNDIRSQQMGMRMELNQLAAKIQDLKSQQKGSVLTGGELDSSLRRSQELSGSLTQIAQSLSQAEAELERDNLALLTALNAELERLRAEWDRQPERAARAQTLARMRTLRQEREQIRAMLPAAKLPALSTTSAADTDPEDLLEQADALRDSEDKVRQKMAALQTRISELREERALDRRMSDFLGDESMFDDQDRRLRQTREVEAARQAMPPLLGGQAESDAAGSAPAEPPTSNEFGTSGETKSTDPVDSRAGPSVSLTLIAKGADSRPQVGGVNSVLLEDANPADLEALQAQLEKLKKLAGQLDSRADEIEARAKELE